MYRKPRPGFTLDMNVLSFLQPCAMRAIPLCVMSSHHETVRLVSWGQPWPRALSELSVRLEQLEMLREWSLVQCWARQWNVLSDSFLQVDRSRVSMLQQVWENVHRAESPTFWVRISNKYRLSAGLSSHLTAVQTETLEKSPTSPGEVLNHHT